MKVTTTIIYVLTMTCVSIHQFLAVEESALQHSGVDNSEVRNTLAFNYETPPNNQICDK